MTAIDTSLAPSLQLRGAGTPIKSAVVDIYPLPPLASFRTSRINQTIPDAMEFKDEAAYLNALRDERTFQEKLGKDLPELPDTNDIAANHQFFVDRGLGHLGLRNLTLNGDQISGTHCIVPHPAYITFNQHENVKMRTFGANLGACGILVTSDNKLVIQHRSHLNRAYGDIPGASIAGLISADGLQNADELDLISVARNHLLHEAQEEIGLSPSVNESVTVTGFLIDKVALHNELTFSIRTQLTGNQIAENALRNRQAQNGANFKENIVILDATSDVVERLLTRIDCPFPVTHAGPLLMLGQELATNEGQNGSAWLNRVKQSMDENYRKIDSLCTDGKYNPNKNSASQGLPSFTQELNRVFNGEYVYVPCAWDPVA